MKSLLPIVAILLASLALLCLPSPRPIAEREGKSVRAEVIASDLQSVEIHGLLRFGTQMLQVRLLEGEHHGEVYAAANEIRAQLETDKIFEVGDEILVTIPQNLTSDSVLVARDHWRLTWGLVLFLGFAILLGVFGGLTGVKALISFIFSGICVWKVLIPVLLLGYNAAWVSLGVVTILTAVIMYLVAGISKKGLAATMGSVFGSAASLLLAAIFANLMKVNGATLPYVQALIYSGYTSLDIADIFIGAVVIASSGAVMDLAMDIASGIEEVDRHAPGLGFKTLLWSGFRIGRSVTGTMTTTLLLAYSGGYLTLLMAFMAQGVPPIDFLNSTILSAEMVKTVVGSFGLVLVAPLTALVSAWLFHLREKR